MCPPSKYIYIYIYMTIYVNSNHNTFYKSNGFIHLKTSDTCIYWMLVAVVTHFIQKSYRSLVFHSFVAFHSINAINVNYFLKISVMTGWLLHRLLCHSIWLGFVVVSFLFKLCLVSLGFFHIKCVLFSCNLFTLHSRRFLFSFAHWLIIFSNWYTHTR